VTIVDRAGRRRPVRRLGLRAGQPLVPARDRQRRRAASGSAVPSETSPFAPADAGGAARHRLGLPRQVRPVTGRGSSAFDHRAPRLHTAVTVRLLPQSGLRVLPRTSTCNLSPRLKPLPVTCSVGSGTSSTGGSVRVRAGDRPAGHIIRRAWPPGSSALATTGMRPSVFPGTVSSPGRNTVIITARLAGPSSRIRSSTRAKRPTVPPADRRPEQADCRRNPEASPPSYLVNTVSCCAAPGPFALVSEGRPRDGGDATSTPIDGQPSARLWPVPRAGPWADNTARGLQTSLMTGLGEQGLRPAAGRDPGCTPGHGRGHPTPGG